MKCDVRRWTWSVAALMLTLGAWGCGHKAENQAPVVATPDSHGNVPMSQSNQANGQQSARTPTAANMD